MFSWARAKCVG